MGGGDLNLKKSWHPHTMKNQERVWKAEQAKQEEQRKLDDLRKEINEERDREELRRLGENSGVLSSNNGGEAKLEWMYKNNTELINREEYLLGRKIDKSFEQLEAEERRQEQSTLGLKQSINHVEHECVPFSIREYRNLQSTEQVDMQRKTMEDPLMLIKQREMESRRKLLENPVKLKEIHRILKTEREAAAKREKKPKKSKKSKKKKHKRSSSEDDSDSDDNLDKKLARQMKKLKGEGTNEDFKLDKLLDAKYRTLTKQLDMATKQKKHKNKKKSKKRSDSSSESESEEETSKSKSKEQRSRRARSDSSEEERGKRRERRERSNSSGKERVKNSKEQRERRERSRSGRRDRSRSVEQRGRRDRSRSIEERSSRRERQRGDDRRQPEQNYNRRSPRREQRQRSRSPRREEQKRQRSRSTKREQQMRQRSKSPRQQRQRSRSPRRETRRRSRSPRRDQQTTQRRNSRERQRRSPTPEKRRAPSPTPVATRQPAKTKPKLSDSEREARLREMMDNATWREADRTKVVQKHREEYAREEAQHQARDFDQQFINKEVKKAIDNQTSIGNRIRSNLNNIQRNSSAMDANFARK
ncbi:pre-mRNA-splicing factor CWC25 homolog [Drosophila sulfurigaster albostrigata]|uniref:pre-mRNA-splicing factor CWC25 homolog n=1 Tax=Drosophila sulfurigaster albostrigata TaxID=89887 RepID=UPI002D219A13|nr:pre-mRNA-splicing factor CWC25 homolog [Drosophila sulfurigaster albostrigata]XP_062125676.1 pre-mRNA-splicing factor CWC25 homolog [Drosophila sulfurigaster albostrigata]